MQLRNRMIKANLWTDTELAANLPAAGRMFYIGLWQLAEDSGCIEDDVMAYKMILFPLDDVTINQIQEWTDVLVELSKLIPYDSNGKKCYFLTNFHRHQTLRNPGKPEIPLPEWVEYVPNEEAYKAGGYIIDYSNVPNSKRNDIITVGNVNVSLEDDEENTGNLPGNDKGSSIDSSENDHGNVNDSPEKPMPNQYKENIKEYNTNLTTTQQEGGSGSLVRSIHDSLLQNFGGTHTKTQIDKLLDYVEQDGMDAEMVTRAIELTAEKKQRGKNIQNLLTFTEGILKNWRENKIYNLEQLEESESQGNDGEVVDFDRLRRELSAEALEGG